LRLSPTPGLPRGRRAKPRRERPESEFSAWGNSILREQIPMAPHPARLSDWWADAPGVTLYPSGSAWGALQKRHTDGHSISGGGAPASCAGEIVNGLALGPSGVPLGDAPETIARPARMIRPGVGLKSGSLPDKHPGAGVSCHGCGTIQHPMLARFGDTWGDAEDPGRQHSISGGGGKKHFRRAGQQRTGRPHLAAQKAKPAAAWRPARPIRCLCRLAVASPLRVGDGVCSAFDVWSRMHLWGGR
jgi:hypothetical protein